VSLHRTGTCQEFQDHPGTGLCFYRVSKICLANFLSIYYSIVPNRKQNVSPEHLEHDWSSVASPRQISRPVWIAGTLCHSEYTGQDPAPNGLYCHSSLSVAFSLLDRVHFRRKSRPSSTKTNVTVNRPSAIHYYLLISKNLVGYYQLPHSYTGYLS